MKDIIANRRKELGLTQQELAAKLRISAKVVSKWETGRSLPDTSMLLDLSKVLEISVNELLDFNEQQKQDAKEISLTEAETKFKNLFIITMAIQLIAAILIGVGRILRERMQYYGSEGEETLYYILIVLGVLIEIGALSYYLVARNNLFDKYPSCMEIDKKYIDRLLLCTYILVLAITMIFVVYHGLSDVEQLITLLIFACIFSIPFIACYIWNKKRKR